MNRALAIIGQFAAYALFAVALGYLSVAPAYSPIDPGQAVIKLSFTHPGQLKGECRELSPEEIAGFAPNMRRPLECPRERLPVRTELTVDGATVFAADVQPSGLWRDGAATVYRKFPIAPGRHVIVARLRDSARAEGFDYERAETVEIAARRNFVIDFRAAKGGFEFR